jgi:hypothetical protein
LRQQPGCGPCIGRRATRFLNDQLVLQQSTDRLHALG